MLYAILKQNSSPKHPHVGINGPEYQSSSIFTTLHLNGQTTSHNKNHISKYIQGIILPVIISHSTNTISSNPTQQAQLRRRPDNIPIYHFQMSSTCLPPITTPAVTFSTIPAAKACVARSRLRSRVTFRSVQPTGTSHTTTRLLRSVSAHHFSFFLRISPVLWKG